MRQIIWIAALLLATSVSGAGNTASIIVNGAPLDAHAQRELEARYGALQPGSYWYDSFSGLWGLDGGPSVGQIIPGMRLGRMAPNASVKSFWLRTFVFVNGREIHPREYAYLHNLFGGVNPGRYWLNAQGVAGYEGGPPQFDLRAAAMSRGNQGGNQSGGGYGRRGAFGNTGSDGRCSYYNDVDSGASVMVGNC